MCHLKCCRLVMQHSHVLQDLAGRLPAAYRGDLTLPQAMALQTQATAAALCAVNLTQLCVQAQLPGSSVYRLASSASLAVFAQGVQAMRWYMQLSVSRLASMAEQAPGLLEVLAPTQGTLLGMLTALLGVTGDGQRMQQLYARTVAGAPAAADWLACAAQAMCTVCQKGEHLSEDRDRACWAWQRSCG